MNKSIVTMVMGIIAIAIAFIVFPIVLDATTEILDNTENWQEEDSSTTVSPDITDDIVLTYALYEDDVAKVVSITSTEGTDVPTADSYVAGTKTLTVGGLTTDITRTLTTTYETESMNVYTGLGSIAQVMPLLVFVGLLAGGGFGLFRGIKSVRGKA